MDHDLTFRSKVVGYASQALRERGRIIDGPEVLGKRSSVLPFVVPDEDGDALVSRLRSDDVHLALRDGKLRLVLSYDDTSDVDGLIEAL